MRCPHCKSPSTRQGTKSRRLLTLDDGGKPVLREARLQRWRCSSCQRYFTEEIDKQQYRRLATIEARDAVARSCFHQGFSAAARALRIDEKTVRSLWNEWAEARETSLPEFFPAAAGCHLLTLAGIQRALLTDIEEMTILDVVEAADRQNMVRRLRGFSDLGAATWIAISVHEPFRALVSEELPHAIPFICKEETLRLAQRHYVSAFRSLRRDLRYRGTTRNVKEDLRLFLKNPHDLSDDEREELSGWDDSVLCLRASKATFLDAVNTEDHQMRRQKLDEASYGYRQIAGNTGLMLFVRHWQDEILNGLLKNTAAYFPLLDRLVAAWQSRKPALPFVLARALVVLLQEQNIAAPEYAHVTPGLPGMAHVGVYMPHALQTLSK